ncbi:MAG: fused MFS/spermidine synthase [Alphaproteobacteria bacterium]|nr:fused MFS/spermidine synthase [Alphaproteobacteria bacterium]
MSASADNDALAFRQRNAVRALVPLFVFSGATSLVYQTLWVRQLHLVVGTSQLAVATVLAAFMTGLAAGGFLGGRFADTAKKPILTYAILEALIGLYALAFPFLLDLVEPVYLEFWRANEPSPGAFFSFQFVLLGILLLPPTTCMGATLPFLARFATSPETHDAQRASTSDAGERVGRLYGANTIGAVVGTGLAGFVLLPRLGLTSTTWLTAGGNALLCVLAIAIATRAGEIAPAPRAERKRAGAGFFLLAAVAFLAGFSGLVLEVAWFRVLGLNLGGSAYAFSIMLLAFLIGIGTGGWTGGGLADRVYRRFGHAGVLTGLAALELGVAVLTWGTMYAYGELPYLFTALFGVFEEANALEWIWPAKLFIALLVTFPAAACMGAAFPFLVRAAADDHDALGGPVGTLYGWNTVGGIFGAALGSLVFLPQLHVTRTSILAIGLNVLAAVLAIGAAEWTRGRRGVVVGWAIAGLWAVGLVAWKPPPWEPLLMTAGMYKYAGDLSDRTRAGVYAFAVEPYDLLFYDEGLSSVVTVAQSRSTDNIWLANNGKVDASTSIDMPTQVLCAQLPFAFHPDAKQAVVIGLASGITAGAVTLNSRLEHIDIIELEPAILEASHLFDEYNHRPLDDPRTTLIANDGRNHITLVPDGTYDVVVSEPSNPWLSGVSNLFTQEFFTLGKRKLKPGGVWSQWVQMYGMNQDDLRTLVKTFASVYPHVRLFSTIEDADLVLIGSDRPLDIGVDALGRLWDIDEDITFELAGIHIVGPYDLLTRYQLDHDQIMAFAGDVPVNTDDNMRIEYSAPLHLHEDTAEANFRALLGDREERKLPLDAVEGVEGLKELARSYHRRERLVEALVVVKEAYKLAPDDEELEGMYDAWQGELLEELEE